MDKVSSDLKREQEIKEETPPPLVDIDLVRSNEMQMEKQL